MRVKKCCYVCDHYDITIRNGELENVCDHADIRFAYNFDHCCDKFLLESDLACSEVKDERS